MNIHKNARLTPHGRAEVVRQVREAGTSARAAARAAKTTEKTVRKWVARAAAGEPLTDRSSRPHQPPATPAAVQLRVKVLRQRDRLTLTEIAATLAISRATVGRIVARCGWSRLHVLELPSGRNLSQRQFPWLLPRCGRISIPAFAFPQERQERVKRIGDPMERILADLLLRPMLMPDVVPLSEPHSQQTGTRMIDALRKHWPEYLMEAAELGLFMISACAFTVLLYHPSSALAQNIHNDMLRRMLMGTAMGSTAIAIISASASGESRPMSSTPA